MNTELLKMEKILKRDECTDKFRSFNCHLRQNMTKQPTGTCDVNGVKENGDSEVA